MPYQLIYTYTGQRNAGGKRSVPLNKFAVSGDMDRQIGQILSVQYEHYHSSTRAATWVLRGRLIFGDGTSLTSDAHSLYISGNVLKFENGFPTLPTPEQWALLTEIQTLDSADRIENTGSDPRLYWRATRDNPMRIILTFIEEPPVTYAPEIEDFAVARVDEDGVANDEGEYLATTMKLAIGDEAGLASAALRIYYAANAYPVIGEADYIDLTSGIRSLLDGVALNPTIIPGKWSVADTWYFAAVFLAGEESDVATATVARAGGSLHISREPGGGACVGGYSGGTRSSPKFESYVPSYLYGGVVQLGSAKQSLRAMGIQSGTVDESVCATGVSIFSISFDVPFESAPAVFAMPVGGDGSLNLAQLSCMVAPGSITESGFNAYIHNATGAQRSIGIHWFAIGIPQYDPDAVIVLRRPAAPMKANSSGGCVASASSVYGSAYPAWRAFDYSLSTGWASRTDDVKPWIQLKLDAALVNISVKVFARKTSYIHNPTAGTILGSTDGESFHELAAFSGWDAGANGKLLGMVECKNQTPYRYVRLSISAAGGDQGYAAVGYIEISGEKPPETSEQEE